MNLIPLLYGFEDGHIEQVESFIEEKGLVPTLLIAYDMVRNYFEVEDCILSLKEADNKEGQLLSLLIISLHGTESDLLDNWYLELPEEIQEIFEIETISISHI